MITDTDRHYFGSCEKYLECKETLTTDPFHVNCVTCIPKMLKGSLPHKCVCGVLHVDLGAQVFVGELKISGEFNNMIENKFAPPQGLPNHNYTIEVGGISANANRAIEIAEDPLFALAQRVELGWMTQKDLLYLEKQPFCETRVFHRELAKRLAKMDV